MNELIFTVGLPRAGKDTWVQHAFRNHKRLNRDDMRAMIDHGVHTPENEKLIIEAQQSLAITFLERNYSVVIVDTNLRFDYIAELIFFLRVDPKVICKLVVVDTPLETCIRREFDTRRTIPEEAFNVMHQKLINVKNEIKDNPSIFVRESIVHQSQSSFTTYTIADKREFTDLFHRRWNVKSKKG